VVGFSYVAVCLLFSSLFLFRIVRIRRRRKVHVRYLLMSFLLSYRRGNRLLVIWPAQKSCMPKVGFAIQYSFVCESVFQILITMKY